MNNPLKSLICFFTLLLCLPLVIRAQVSEKEKVFHTVTQLFHAMETNDSTLAASLFTEDAQLFTLIESEHGVTQLRKSPATRLASAFASEKTVTWREPIWNEKIEVADGLASVWVDYAFYLGDTFSHCGVDAFHLIKKGQQWKIFHLADTRKKTGCEIPEEIKTKFDK